MTDTPFAQQILLWFDEHRRNLPWRDTRDPYHIWISEIILQQTRISQGLDYYLRFIKAFPTVAELAQASEDEVLRMWQGLGYYSRARNLHAAAQQIVEQGAFPRDYAGIRALKGIGDYTAAAISSFAYNLPYAPVDGNVYRVLSRFFGIETPIDSTAGKKLFASLAKKLLPSRRTADYNQALMDFGSLQCTISSPRCESCPLEMQCIAHATHSEADLPVKSKRPQVTKRYFNYIRIETSQGIWLHRRKDGDIWQGLYEFPLIETSLPVSPDKLKPLVTDQLGIASTAGKWMVLARHIKHVLTHRIIYADIYALMLADMATLPKDYILIPNDRIKDYAMPRLLIPFK